MYGEEQEHVPNFVITPQEASGMKCRKLYFYPADIKKAEKLSFREKNAYNFFCYRAGRYCYSKQNADSHKEPPLNWLSPPNGVDVREGFDGQFSMSYWEAMGIVLNKSFFSDKKVMDAVKTVLANKKMYSRKLVKIAASLTSSEAQQTKKPALQVKKLIGQIKKVLLPANAVKRQDGGEIEEARRKEDARRFEIMKRLCTESLRNRERARCGVGSLEDKNGELSAPLKFIINVVMVLIGFLLMKSCSR